ncbi:MAG: 2-C-methyl-D-erythritol 4-phosphate cytidylyltransferase [Coriobacteriales bacterium]|nr:2-C-methyl-D-erythritol 4-phosphate cytidylyltransferase [Coriobacteriales bacterium]MBQ6585870.1 2-C-methyl-D-erythritol 4-phosphate cytidylyltransferase [Coriobacteriales bacterium]
MIFGAILAGGTGTRMNIVDMPKQYLPLGGGKPVIIHTLEKFLLCSRIDMIYIGAHPDWVSYTQAQLERYVPSQIERIKVIEGGVDRTGTIINIIEAIEADHGSSPDHYIITHDAVRPFVSLRIIQDNIDAVLEYKACDTVIPATDTIVVSTDGQVISDIPQRRFMYQGQTPQSFQLDLLKGLYASMSQEERAILTDACKICHIRDIPVHLVTGDVVNLKLTTLGDYKVSQAMIESGASD